MCLTRRGSPTALGTKPSSSKLLLSSALARHVVLRLHRFFPYHCFPLFLRGSSAARKVSVIRRAHTVEVNPGHVRETSALELWAWDAAIQATSFLAASISLGALVFRPYPFQCHLPHFFPCLAHLPLYLRTLSSGQHALTFLRAHPCLGVLVALSLESLCSHVRCWLWCLFLCCGGVHLHPHRDGLDRSLKTLTSKKNM